MNWGEWQVHYRTLCQTYGHQPVAEQCATYFEVLSEFPADAVNAGVVRVAREKTRWPKAAELFDAVRGASRGMAAPKSECGTCGGNGYVEMPAQEHYHRLYAYVGRCPVCRPSKANASAA